MLMRSKAIKLKKSVSIAFICLVLASWPAFAADYDTGVKAAVLIKSMTASNGQKLAYLKTENAEVTAMSVEIAPGRETGWHLHTVPVYAYVMSGKLSVEMDGGRRYEFSEGQVILEVMNTPHNGTNIGTVPVKLVVFYNGEQGKPIVEKVKKAAE